MNLTKQEVQNLDLLDEYETYEWHSEVSKLTSGDSFGELSMIDFKQDDRIVECLTDCYFAVLNKKDFLQVFKQVMAREFQEKTLFFK